MPEMDGGSSYAADSERPQPVVGIVGLGNVGLAAARHLLTAGWPVVGYRRGSSEDFEALGGTRVSSAREVAERAQVLLFALPSAAALEDALFGPTGILSGAPRAELAVDLGTFSLEVKLRAQAALARRGVELLDCPLGGAPQPGSTGRIALALPSGERTAYERCAGILEAFATKVLYVGDFGAGSKMKFVCNVLVAEHTVAAAEAVALGLRAGLDPQLLVDVVGQSPGTSWIWEHRAPLMVSRAYRPPRGSVDMLRKDLGAITAFAEAAGCRLPFLEATARRFDEAAARGYGDHDVAAVFSVLVEQLDAVEADSDTAR
ncbi:MAG TPA: NAD(P)-dependent oxidoreductase [Candidatus Caenarcaniphilales bacterium]|nr:NAD(P)-dependent oxidoreductase [Candidatus Caenarcaniphilales bacterium]